MEFKQLELSQEENWWKRTIRSKRLRKTLFAVIIGAGAGFLYFYFSEGRNMTEITSGDIWNSVLIGGFLGFFVTNSPCARGRC
jgi:hypothetical protein